MAYCFYRPLIQAKRGLSIEKNGLSKQDFPAEKIDQILDYYQFAKKNTPSTLFQREIEKILASVTDLKLCSQIIQEIQWIETMGNSVMARACWLFQKHPEIFKAKYVTNKMAFFKDSVLHRYPTFSFFPLAKGENPFLSRDTKQTKLYFDLYMDPIFNTDEWKNDNERWTPFSDWEWKTFTGRKYRIKRREFDNALENTNLTYQVKTEIKRSEELIKHHQDLFNRIY